MRLVPLQSGAVSDRAKVSFSLFSSQWSSTRMPNDNEIKAELDLGPLPQELVEYAKNEVNEDPETRCQVLSDFRNMIYGKQPDSMSLELILYT